jgi:hypothetical protein
MLALLSSERFLANFEPETNKNFIKNFEITSKKIASQIQTSSHIKFRRLKNNKNDQTTHKTPKDTIVKQLLLKSHCLTTPELQITSLHLNKKLNGEKSHFPP